jgi:hypothetical protein
MELRLCAPLPLNGIASVGPFFLWIVMNCVGVRPSSSELPRIASVCAPILVAVCSSVELRLYALFL